MAIFIKASTTSGRRSAGARRDWTSDPAAFVTFIQNHDQIANSAYGERCHALASPGKLRAITALMLLAPGTPMLFQGQEFGASSPFLFFADHNSGTQLPNPPGPRRVSRAVPQPCYSRNAEAICRPRRSRYFRTLQAGSFRARDTSRDLRSASRSAEACAGDEPVFRAQKHARFRRRGALLRSLPAAFFRRPMPMTGLLLVNLGSRSASRSRARAAARSASRFRMEHSMVERRSQVWRYWNAATRYGGELANSRPRRRRVEARVEEPMTDLVIRMPWPGKDGTRFRRRASTANGW